jgi:serine/threonine protein kinase
MDGGRLLAQGLYGCVFVPSLTCQVGTEEKLEEGVQQRIEMLSKLTPSGDAIQEYQISKHIHQIPFYKQYFAVTESICQPADQQKQKEQDLPQCQVLKETVFKEMKLLRMPYAGKALYQVQFSLPTFDFRAFAIHLISGGALMNLFGIVHRDLHQGNVLVDSHNVPRIIDFNLSISVRSTPVKASDLSHKHEIDITQEPPDSTLVNAVAHGESVISVIQNIAYRKSIINKLVAVLGFSKKDIYSRLLGFYKKSKSIRSGDVERWFSLYHRVVDSWAIGVLLVELIGKLSLWPSAGRLQGQIRGLLPVLRKMCAVHPMERIDCVQALHMLEPRHIILRRYGGKWLEIVGTGSGTGAGGI